MRLLVTSDTHGRAEALRLAIEQQPDARDVIFLGDGVRDCEEVMPAFPDRRFYMVRGNNDWSCPLIGEERFGGVVTVFFHGHVQRVKYGLLQAVYTARERGAKLLLFGHTHEPLSAYDDGLHILNPGSLGYGGTYGIVDITPGGIFTDIREVRR